MRYCFKTFGCKVNQYETQAYREALLTADAKEVDEITSADLLVVNTCTVTDSADTESRRFIQEAAAKNPGLRIVVTGCSVDLDPQGIAALKGVERIVRAGMKDRLADVIGSADGFEGAGPTGGERVKRFEPLKVSYFKGREKAYIKVQDGCDYFCSYCIIPKVRGAHRSRSMPEVLAEAVRLVEGGIKELILTGVCLGAYGRDLSPSRELSDLLDALNGLPGEFRIRLSSVDPRDVNDRLMAQFGRLSRLCPHLHLPLQSGDDGILQRMRRGYVRSNYASLVEHLRRQIPDFSISTDLIVGFPGEDAGAFEATLASVEAFEFSRSHLFPYSPRSGSLAHRWDDRAGAAEVHSRMKRLQTAAQISAERFRRRFIGKVVEVLIESQPDRATGFPVGYTREYLRVVVRREGVAPNCLMTSVFDGA